MIKSNLAPITYWDAQANVVTALAHLDITHPLNQRIDPFRELAHLNRLALKGLYPGGKIIQARNAIELLVTLRRLGMEPSHQGGKYI